MAKIKRQGQTALPFFVDTIFCILAFGANCFNLAFIMPFSAHYIYDFIKKRFYTLSEENTSNENIKNDMTADEEEYMSCLQRYAQSLHQTIVALQNYQEGFLRKSRGEKLEYSTSKKLLAKYQQSIEAYQKIGLELNSLSYIIF